MDFRPMGVDVAGLNFGLDKLNRELDRHQFIRELTQNSIEAIQATDEGVGDVTWELYPLPVNGQKIHKLCCMDNGVGMSGPEMVEYINTSFKSGKTQGHKANYGIGAKVSALAFNKAGILFMSWKNGEGAMIHLAQDPETGFYGLHKLEQPDGTHGWWSPIGDEDKPDLIKKHGTVVVLMGDDEEQDTFEKPAGSNLPASEWVAAYLQRKYLRFPEGITVRARRQNVTAASEEHQSKYGRRMALLRGQEYLLRKQAIAEGVLEMDGSKAHYWIIDTAIRRGADSASAHVAALCGDELHEALYGPNAYRRLASFGIPVGQSKIVLYVEPDPLQVETNLTRQKLIVDGADTPWDRYAAAFSENMPEPIAKMMQELIEKADARPNKEKLIERLKELKDLLDATHRYRASEDGETNADTPAVGGDPQQLNRTKEDNGKTGGDGGLKSHIYRLIQTAKGDKAKRKKTRSPQPDVIWVSRTEGTREQGFLEDRAAMYSPGSNLITASKDFRSFKKVVNALHAAVPQANGAAEAAAMLEFETVLVETVINLLAMEGTAQWTAEEVKQQFSPESMTNTCNHTFHIVKAAREEVKQQMKKARQIEKVKQEVH